MRQQNHTMNKFCFFINFFFSIPFWNKVVPKILYFTLKKLYINSLEMIKSDSQNLKYTVASVKMDILDRKFL